jgi:RNA polymerase primary sigma factor
MDSEELTLKELAYILIFAEKFEALPLREKTILKMRCGLEGGKKYTLEEIAKKFGVSGETIRQVEVKAFKKLKELMS